MIPFDIYVHPDPSYKPNDWLALYLDKDEEGACRGRSDAGLGGGRAVVDDEMVLAQARKFRRTPSFRQTARDPQADKRIHAQRAYERPGPELSFPLVT